MVFKVDIDKAKKKSDEEKVKQAQYAQFGRRAPIWKPKQGTNEIRLLPAWTDKGPNAHQFWRELYIHWGVGSLADPDPDNTFSVPCSEKTENAWYFLGLPEGEKLKCRVCAYIEKLRSSKDPVNIELAKNLRAKQRLVSNVIDLTDPVWTKDDVKALKEAGMKDDFLPTLGSAKVQIFSYGPTIFNQILDYFQDNIDLTDLISGRDLKIERVGKPGDINTDYRVRPAMQPSKAPVTAKHLETSINNLDEFMPFYDDTQIKAILEGATYEDVRLLKEATVPKQLSDGKTKAKVSKVEEEVEEEAEEVEVEGEEDGIVGEFNKALAAEEAEEEAEEVKEVKAVKPAKKQTTKKFPPLDADGDIDFSKLADEDIENPENAKYVVKKGTDEEQIPYVECYGKAMKFNASDKTCVNDCGLSERCQVRVNQLVEEEKAKEKKKKGIGKKAAPAAEPVAKKKPGRPAKVQPVVEEEDEGSGNGVGGFAGDEASIIAEMERAFEE